MPDFQYKAITREGIEEQGEMHGSSAAAVIRSLQEQGSIPVFAEEVTTSRRGATRLRWSKKRDSEGRPDVNIFTRSLASLLSSGAVLDRALDIMHDVEDDAPTLQLIESIRSSVRGGAALSKAMEEQQGVFSGFYVSMVRAAEMSGTLDEGLQRLLEYLERSRELREKILSALIYPAILLVVAGLSVIVLLTFVVPQFESVFEEMGSALPLATRFVLSVSDFLARSWWLIILLAAGSIYYARRWLADPSSRRRLDDFSLRVPLIGGLIAASETAKFSRSLGTLLINGVPVIQSLDIGMNTLNNRAMAASIADAANSLKEGGELSATLERTGVLPKLAIQMIRVGEEGGNLDQMMLRIAQIYDGEVSTKVQRLLALLEPALIIGLGLVIAGIIMSILVGIISINDLPV